MKNNNTKLSAGQFGGTEVTTKGLQLNPYFITGFSDAESSFVINIELLELIKNFLNCGSIATAGNCKQVLVSNFQDINNIIIPLFAKHCVQGVKHEDYLDFCKAAELIKNKAHLTQEGLDKIIKLKSGMNRGREPGSLVVLET